MRRIALRLPEDLILLIAREAAARGLGVSAYIRAQLYNSAPVNIHQKKN